MVDRTEEKRGVDAYNLEVQALGLAFDQRVPVDVGIRCQIGDCRMGRAVEV